jgi:hypothetical protein
MSTMRLEDHRRQELTSLFPYEGAQRRIDEEITKLDKVKLELEKWLGEQVEEKGSGKAATEDKHG